VDYDVPHKKAWGLDLVLYLAGKGISTGAMFLSALLWLMGDRSTLVGLTGPIISVVFAIFTAIVLVVDLERPERFFYILTRPNWNSWLARGAFLLTAHSGIATVWVALKLFGYDGALVWLAPLALIGALAATAYTGFLFAQGLARDLWQGPHSTIDLLAQAAIEGSAAMLLAAMGGGSTPDTVKALGLTLAFASLAHLTILVLEHLLTPSGTVQHELAVRAIRSGPYKRLFWIGALGVGCVAPLLFVSVASALSFSVVVLALAALTALAGGVAWEYIWVDAGQSVANS
jgi:formate-dependent nitrite reductase membrane component NrfD